MGKEPFPPSVLRAFDLICFVSCSSRFAGVFWSFCWRGCAGSPWLQVPRRDMREQPSRASSGKARGTARCAGGAPQRQEASSADFRGNQQHAAQEQGRLQLGRTAGKHPQALGAQEPRHAASREAAAIAQAAAAHQARAVARSRARRHQQQSRS